MIPSRYRGINRTQKEINAVLKQITDEIRRIVDEETEHDEKWARGLQYSLCIIDKYRGDKNEV